MFYEFPVWNSKSSSTHDDETELPTQSVRRSALSHFFCDQVIHRWSRVLSFKLGTCGCEVVWVVYWTHQLRCKIANLQLRPSHVVFPKIGIWSFLGNLDCEENWTIRENNFLKVFQNFHHEFSKIVLRKALPFMRFDPLTDLLLFLLAK